MSLREVLRDSSYTGLTDAECVARLAEVVEISRDTSLKSVRDIQAALEPSLNDFRLVWGTFEAAVQSDPAMRAYMTTISSVGVNMTNATLRGIIATLAAAGEWPDAVRDAILALGIVSGPRWQQAGLGAEPTEAEVTAARTLNTVETQAVAWFNEVVSELGASVNSWQDALDLLPE